MAHNNRDDTYRPITELSGFMESRLDGFEHRLAVMLEAESIFDVATQTDGYQAGYYRTLADWLAGETRQLVEDLRAGM